MKAQPVVTGTWRYVPVADRELPEAERSVFVLRPLTFGERMDAFDSAEVIVDPGKSGVRESRLRNFRVALEIVLSHLVSAENFPSGSPRPWPQHGSREEREAYLALVGEVGILELAHEVWRRSSLGDVEGEASGPSLTLG